MKPTTYALSVPGSGGVVYFSPDRIVAIPGLVVFVKERDQWGDTWVRIK